MKKLMIVDDDEDVLESLKLLLESYYSICLTRNGVEALEEMDRGFRPDLILLDLKTPGLDNPALLTELKRRGEKIPVLVISALPDAAERARENGLSEVLQRPFTYQQLREKIERILKDSGGSQAIKGSRN
jgi:two-component system alkaline phosphatase synthesis response regulator PhoP